MGTFSYIQKTQKRDDVRVVSVTLDFARTPRSSGDVLQLFQTFAGETARNVVVDVETAEGGTLTADIGHTGGDTDGYYNSANLNSEAKTSKMVPMVVTQGSPSTVAPGFGFGYFYAADDTIDMLLNNDADTAVVHVSATIERGPRRYNQVLT